jgi:vacuolar-type H+-ATPase subunit H
MPGDDIIDRLMSVEHEAELLVEHAQADADTIVRETEQAERARYDAAVAARIGELAAILDHRRGELAEERNATLSRYQEDLKSRPLDRPALHAVIDSLLST